MKIKENFCRLEFYCREPKKRECVYFSETNKLADCKYMNGEFCESAVAQVNVMTLAIKERKGKRHAQPRSGRGTEFEFNENR